MSVKGCPHCMGDAPITNKNNDFMGVDFLAEDKHLIFSAGASYTKRETLSIPINFCPKCGRDLNVLEETGKSPIKEYLTPGEILYGLGCTVKESRENTKRFLNSLYGESSCEEPKIIILDKGQVVARIKDTIEWTKDETMTPRLVSINPEREPIYVLFIRYINYGIVINEGLYDNLFMVLGGK